jgi:choice-of-anchor A domain-containing protein
MRSGRRFGWAIAGILCALLSLSVEAQVAPEVAAGRDWLGAQVRSDGSLTGETGALATVTQTRVEVLDTLSRLGVAPTSLANRIAGQIPDSSVEHLARLILAGAASSTLDRSLLTRLKALQRADGGFGGAKLHESTAIDTSFALIALRAAGETADASVARAVSFLAARAGNTDSDGLHAADAARPYLAAYTLVALQTWSADYAIAGAVDTARTQLIGLQGTGAHAEVLLNAAGAMALGFSSTSGTGLDTLRQALRDSQQANGSWQNDPYLTALALRGLIGGASTPPPTTGRVTATIREAQGLAPLSGASLRLTGASVLSASSGGNGRVVVLEVPPGDYSLRVEKEGFVAASANGISVRAAQTLDLGYIDLARAAGSAVLRGRVSSVADGSPIAGAAVTVSGALDASVFTGPDGRYEILSTSAGAISIAVTRSGYVSAQASASLALGSILEFNPALYPNGFEPPTSAILTGRIVAASDESPIAGARVTVGSRQALTDAAGSFQLAELPVGSVQAAISAQGFLGASLTGTLAPGVNDAGLIRLAADVPPTSSSVTGLVRDSETLTAIAGAVVEVTGSAQRASTGADGRYRIEGISQLPFALAVTAPGYRSGALSFNAQTHGNYSGDLLLTRLTGGAVALEGLAVSSPEIDPYTEIGIIGSLRNTGTQPAGLIFNAVVLNAQQQVVRDVPAIMMTFASRPGDNVIEIAPGATRDVPIVWGVQSDLPGEYSVVFRGIDPGGQVVVEGTTGYRVRAVQRLGGSVVVDPPLLQAGLGQSVSIDANLANHGNLPIPAGTAELTVTLVKADTRPPLPPEPTIGNTLINGAPLNRPWGSTRDAAGRVYTLNYNARELVRIEPNGQAQVLRALSPFVSGSSGTQMGNPYAVEMHPDGRLRVAWTNPYVSIIETEAPYTQTNVPGVTSSTTAYAVDAAGNEYFGGTYQGRTRVVKRSPGGLVTPLADAGAGAASGGVVGPDGGLYLSNNAQGIVYRVDPTTKVATEYATGLNTPRGLLFEPDGSLLIAENTPNRIRRFRNGALTEFATGITAVDELRRGQDGAVYALNLNQGTLTRIAADGSQNQRFAGGIVNDAVAVHFDAQGRLLVLGDGLLRRRNLDGNVETLATGLSGSLDVVEAANGDPLILQSSSIRRVGTGGVTTEFTASGVSLHSFDRSDAGRLLVTAQRGGERGIYEVAGNTLTPISLFPASVTGLVQAGGESVAWSSTALFKIGADGHLATFGEPFLSLTAVSPAPGGVFYAYENGGTAAQRGVYRVEADGSRTRISAALSSYYQGFAVDGSGRIVYGRSDRALARFNPASGETETLGTIPNSAWPQDVRIDAEGTIYLRATSAVIWRVDATEFVQVATNTSSLLPADDGRLWWLSSTRVHTLGADGAPQLRYTFVSTPNQVSVRTDGLLVWRNSPSRFEFIDPSMAVVRGIDLPGWPRSMAIDGSTVYITDTNGRLTRFTQGQPMQRLGGDSPGFDRVRVDGGRVLASRASGIVEVSPTGTQQPVWSQPSWAQSQYSLFDLRGNQVVAENSSTAEIVLQSGSSPAVHLAPFRYASSFVQMASGVWVVLDANQRLVEVRSDGQQSRVVSTNPGVRSLALGAQGELLGVSNQTELYRFDANYAAVGLAAPDRTTAGTGERVFAGGGEVYVTSSQGQIYRRDAHFLRRFASGVSNVGDIAVDSTGKVYVLDEGNDAMGVIVDSGFQQLATGFSNPTHLALLGDHTVLITTSGELVAADTAGRWSRKLWSVSSPGGIQSIGDGRAWVFDYSQSRLFEVAVGTVAASIPEGTVVLRRQLPHAAMGLLDGEILDFGAWTPPAGGDYELAVRSTDSGLQGRAVSGLHVGPNAQALMTADPARVVPGDAEIRVKTRIEGANFSSLSRVDPNQLQLVLPQSFYPPAMGADASGSVWYSTSGRLYRAPPGTANGIQVGSDALTGFRGEIPIDSQQRAYAIANLRVGSQYRNVLRRYDSDGVATSIATFTETVQAITIDERDHLYAVVPGKIYRISPTGTVEDYAVMPAGSPYGLTRDGAGNLYVQMNGNIIYRVDPLRQVTTVLNDAHFEYEGVNITGTCAEGLFFTPMNYQRVGQSGEEYTIAQVLGSTGEIGPIFNGRVVSQDLVDIDFIVYDRFASSLLIFSENYSNNSRRLFRMPVTCGAIDVDMHIVVPAGQAHHGINPPATQTIARSDGSVELVWELRDVNRQGIELEFLTRLVDLRRGQSMPVAAEAWMEFRNSFVPGTVRVPVQVPSVFVDDLVSIDVSTDRPSYPPNTAVDIDAFLRNLDDAGKQGRLLLQVEDAQGQVVENLIDRQEVFGPLEERELDPPFNTGSHRAGAYVVVARILDTGGRVVAEDSAAFEIVTDSTQPTLSSQVATDKPSYSPQQTVLIDATVSNLSLNQGFSSLTVRERVIGPDGSPFWSAEQPLRNLEPGARSQLAFSMPLGAAAAGNYVVRQQVLNAQGAVLSEAHANFSVIATDGNQALSGTLSVDPAAVARGSTAALRAQVRNRGNTALVQVPLSLRMLDPRNGNAVLRQWPFARDLAVGASFELASDWATAGVTPGAYVAVLVAALNGQEVVLDQKPVTVLAVVLEGAISAQPSSALPTDPVQIAATARNRGNLAATALPFTLSVLRADSGTVVREWTYTDDLAIGASLQRAETLAAGSLAMGRYRVRWSVLHEGQTQILGTAEFEVLGAQIGGMISALPQQTAVMNPVQLDARVNNSGNAPASALPVRIEVRRTDTQALMDAWTETVDVAAGGQINLQRSWTGSVASRYDAVLSARIEGVWRSLSQTTFELTAPKVDVDLSIAVQRDARLLVLVSCEPSANGNALSSNESAAAQPPSACALQRKQFLETFLAQRGIDHKVVTDDKRFMSELRCGRYNVYWLSGGTQKLAEIDAKELRETIYRGDGLLIDGSHDQRTSFLDEMAGYRYSGHLPTENLTLRGTGTLFPVVDVPTYGRALRLDASTGQIQARFPTTSTAASISNNFGQGRALIWGFDLVEVLKRDTTVPASVQLFDNGLTHVAPLVVGADFARGSYVPVTTTVENRAQAVDLRLKSSVSEPSSVVAAMPEAASRDARSAQWDFNLPAAQSRSFDLGVRVDGEPASNARVLSELWQRSGPLLQPLSNVSTSLPLRDPSLASKALIAALNAANLRGGEAAARDRAVKKIGDAFDHLQAGEANRAIAGFIDAAEEIVRITSVPHASWRLANARLLEVAQRAACGSPVNACDALGVAGQYNGFFFGDFVAGSSDVQGRLAAGGQIRLNHYSIGDQLPADFRGPSLLAYGDISFPSGRVYRGDIVAGGSVAGVGSAVVNGLGAGQSIRGGAVMPVDFAAERIRLIGESARLASIPVNTTWENKWGGLYLHGDGRSELQVFSLPGDAVLAAHTFAVDGIPAGASVLINVRGSHTGLTNMSMSSLTPHRARVLFNFPQAIELTLAGISVEGSVLAPLAAINKPQGVIWGSVVAQSWNGDMQINLSAFAGCLAGDAGAPPQSICDSSPAHPVLVQPQQGSFSAFNPLARLEARGGQNGNADWEWGLGGNVQSASQFAAAHMTWKKDRDYRFTVIYDGKGNGSFMVYDGPTRVADKRFDATTGNALATGNALELAVRSSADAGTAKVQVRDLVLEAVPVEGQLATAGNSAASEGRLVYFNPSLSDGFELGGTIRLSFTGGQPPQGTRLNFTATAGTLRCAGATP